MLLFKTKLCYFSFFPKLSETLFCQCETVMVALSPMVMKNSFWQRKGPATCTNRSWIVSSCCPFGNHHPSCLYYIVLYYIVFILYCLYWDGILAVIQKYSKPKYTVPSNPGKEWQQMAFVMGWICKEWSLKCNLNLI